MILKLVLVLVTTLGVALTKYPDVPFSDIRSISPINDGSYRLPNDTIPIHYDVLLEPDFEAFTFEGRVMITVLVVEETNTITLHINELTIHTSEVSAPVNSVLRPTVADTQHDEEHHFYIISLEDPVDAGESLEVVITFTGILNNDNRGFYRASYLEDGIPKWFGTTQFESTSARQAFPCYDEPAFKATFTIRFIREEPYHAISNMDPAEGSPFDQGDGTWMDVFQESVPMSTYLVAFIVSEMNSTGRSDNQAVYAAPAHIADDRGEYARATGIATLAAIHDFTGVEYSLSKLDQVAIPDAYFSAGAMENWGLVTYRESYILYKEGLSTSSEKQRIAAIISHELGHQWFGNIVSPLWWTYIWLNEGFATYFEHYATDQVDPELRMMDQYVLLVSQYAMDNDGLTTTRPMSQYGETPSEISRLFDRIAYEKAGSVIRMMEHFLTTETFRRGLNIYLTNRHFAAAEPSDLWFGMQSALEELESTILGELTVEEIMETWNTNIGFPVISVRRNQNGKVVLSQTRFFLERNEPQTPDSQVWIVPINYYNADPDNDLTDTKAAYWLTEAEATTDIDLGQNEWFILNKQAIGYYRVNYTEELWRSNIAYLNSDDYNKIHVTARTQMINDAYNLVRSGGLSHKILMDLLTYIEKETDYVPLYNFFNVLTYLHKYLVNTGESYEVFKRVVWHLLDRAYKSVRDDPAPSHTVKLNKINVYTWLCRLGHQGCLEETNALLTAENIASPDEQTIVYCGGLMTDENSETNWQYVFDRYMGDEAESLEKSRLLSALGCTGSKTQLEKWLGIIFGLDDDYTNTAFSISTAFTAIVSSHKFGLDTAFDYVIDNFQEIQGSLTATQVYTILNALSNRLTTRDQHTRMENFYDSLEEALQAQHAAAFTAALGIIESNIADATLFISEIQEWLAKYLAEFGYRLPTNTKPISYVVTLEPEFEGFTFIGNVIIAVEVLSSTRTIVWHEYDLEISSIEVRRRGAIAPIPLTSDDEYDETFQMRKVVLAEDVYTSDILEITIDYTGKLNEENQGFYRAKYDDEDGESHWYGTTQFEAVYARRAFPCYDEPALKATFTIRIVLPQGYNAISNTYQDNNVVENGKTITVFRETVKMSTYLVAFVVSEFEGAGVESNQNVYGEPRFIKEGRGDYARTTGIATLNRLQTYTGINYHLEKIDQVAIGDAYFTFGAMENWGLVTYRARLLFYKADVNTAAEKESIATVIAHEYAHQWFGNLVSPAWWQHIWLNEGFATYLESYIGNLVESNMGIMSRYILNNNQRAMEYEGSSASRPMELNIDDPKDIMTLFDRIAYQKSGSVIRMMEHFLTTDIFQRGLNVYLNSREFQAAVPDDLWSALQSVVDQRNPTLLGDDTVAGIMESWISQAGYPVVTVTRTEDGGINLAQQRFYLTAITGNPIWSIPINYVTSVQNLNTGFANTAITSWLKEATGSIEVELAEDEWIILNKQGIGYYRVDYDDTTWQLITEYLNSENYANIPAASRSQLIDDIMNLAKAGRATYNQVFDLLTYLEKETDYIPLYTYLRELDFLDKYLMASDEHYDIFKLFVRNSLAAAYEDIETGTASHTMTLKRNRVWSWLCKMDHASCLENLHTELDKTEEVDPDMQTLVYCSGLMTDENTEKKWNFLFDRFKDASIETTERARILSALGCTTSETQLNRWLNIIAGTDEDATIEDGDRMTALTATINAHKFGFDTTLQYVVDNFDALDTKLGSTNIISLIGTIANKITSNAQRTQVQGLITSLNTAQQAAYQEAFSRALSTITANIELLGDRLDDIKGWLEEYDSGAITFSISISLMLMALLSHLFM